MTTRIAIKTLKAMKSRRAQYSWKTFRELLDKHQWRWEFIGDGPAVHAWYDYVNDAEALVGRKKIEADLLKMDRARFYSFYITRD